MSTTTFDARTTAPISTGPLRQLVARHSIAIYFALVVLISWGTAAIVLGPSAFPLTWERFEKLGGAMYVAFLAGPVIAGLAMIGIVDGRKGYRELLVRVRTWRVGARVWATALVPALVLAVVALLLGLIVPAFRPAIVTASDKASLVLPAIAVSLMFGFFEELGWTGFVIPKLLRRHGTIATGVVVGLVWGAWHFPLFWKTDSFSGTLPLVLLLVQLFSWLPGFRILMIRLYERTDSLLVPVVMHASLVTTQLILLPGRLSERASLLHIVIWAATVWSVVAILFAAGPAARPRRPRSAPGAGAP